ncbi:MAG: terminase family protein [Alphaproteobacteria bacterium]|nr:terminase family protein [Alphaproteobacteria bacterium]
MTLHEDELWKAYRKWPAKKKLEFIASVRDEDYPSFRKEAVRNSFEFWCNEALSPLGFSPARHHRLLIRELEAVSDGDVDRLMVLMPPGSAKSTYVSELFPPWLLSRKPRSTIIAASHTGELAERFGRKVRNRIIEHGDLLGFGLASDRKAAGQWETSEGGEYFAAGVGGAVTGRRSDLGIIDDPVKSREEAESPTIREKVWDWYRSDFYTRLKPGAAIVLVMTRWHEEDLGGKLLDEMSNGGDQWRVLKLPALANAADDPLGRKINEPLWPGWEGVEELARKRAAIGERDFGALFQQSPRPAGTSFFDVNNILVARPSNDGAVVYDPVDPVTPIDAVFATIDTAVKTGSKNDGTAVIYWGICKRSEYQLVLLDWDIVQIEGSLLETWLPTVSQNLEGFARQYKARVGSLGSWIEDKASGMILLQQAARRGLQAQPIDSKLTSVGKDERCISVSGYVQRQMVKISRSAYDKVTNYKGKSGNHFLMQVFRFQIGVKDQSDDLLDCFTYGIAMACGDAEGF